MKKTYTILMVLFLSLLSCKQAKPQTNIDRKKAQKIQNKENLDRFFMGVIKLCSDTNYEGFYDNPRPLTMLVTDNCCTNFVLPPYINVEEYYRFVIEGNKDIRSHHNDPFKLQEIRLDWQADLADITARAMKADYNNLIYEGYNTWRIEEFDIEKEELTVGYRSLIQLKDAGGDFRSLLEIENKFDRSYTLSLSAKKAEKLYKYYESIQGSSNLAPTKLLNVRYTYSIRKPVKGERFKNYFYTKIKKAEFFKPDGWSDKLGEVTF